MSWVVERVEAGDFLCWESLDWKLSAEPAITLILGDRGTGKSNGSGKTSLLEAIHWCLWGSTLRKLTHAHRVIRRAARGSKATAWVRLTVRNGSQQYIIERTRRASSGDVRISGVSDKALASGTQSVIDSLFGTSEDFTSTAMFTGEVASFCRLTDSRRKEVLERMLDTARFTAASDRAKVRIDELTEAKSVAERNRAILQDRLGNLRADRAEALLAAARAPGKKLRKWKALRDAGIAAYDEAMEAAARACREVARVRAEAEKVARQREALADQMEEEQSATDGKRKALATAEAAVTDLTAKIRAVKADIHNVTSGQHADICPNCGQRWPHDTEPDAIAKVVDKHRAKIRELEHLLAPAQAEVADLEESVAASDMKIRQLRAAVNRLSTATPANAERALMADAIEAEVRLEAAQRALSDYAKATDLEASPEDLDDIDERLAAAHDAYDAAAAGMADFDQQIADLAFWRRGFSRNGLPSYLIDSAIPEMNRTVAAVANALTEGELSVSFDPAAAKGTGSAFEVAVDYRDGGDGFDASSRGERTRVDVAVLFALRDLAARRGKSTCGQLFLDELMDGADEHFAQSFITMLRTLYAGYDIYLISHDPGVASLVDRTLTVRRRKGAAVLSTRAAA